MPCEQIALTERTELTEKRIKFESFNSRHICSPGLKNVFYLIYVFKTLIVRFYKHEPYYLILGEKYGNKVGLRVKMSFIIKVEEIEISSPKK